MEIGAATAEDSMAILQEIKNGTTMRSSNTTSRYLIE